jgi:hypothetical protein
VLLGKGTGGLQPEVDYTITGAYGQIQAADFSGDGKIDLAVTSIEPPDGVNELVGNGDGTFQASQFFPAGSTVIAGLVAGDLNGDKKPDLAVLDSNLGAITLLNTGAVSFSPTTPINFPAQLIDTSSVPLTVTLVNKGLSALSVQSVKVSGPFQVKNTCAGHVGAGASCTISSVFEPKTAGPFSGLITIQDSASSKPQVIEVFGEGTVLQLLPTELNFGDQKVGVKSQPSQIKVTNKSNEPVTVTGNGINGSDSGDFSESTSCEQTLAAGASCTMSVTFTPRKIGARSANAYIDVSNGANPAPVILEGIGTN